MGMVEQNRRETDLFLPILYFATNIKSYLLSEQNHFLINQFFIYGRYIVNLNPGGVLFGKCVCAENGIFMTTMIYFM